MRGPLMRRAWHDPFPVLSVQFTHPVAVVLLIVTCQIISQLIGTSLASHSCCAVCYHQPGPQSVGSHPALPLGGCCDGDYHLPDRASASRRPVLAACRHYYYKCCCWNVCFNTMPA